MKYQTLALLAGLLLVPPTAFGQAPCKCSPRSPTVIRPYFPVDYSGYQVDGCRGIGRTHQLGRYAQNSTAGGVPFTLRNVIRTLDVLIPCGPRSGHGCGLYCIGAGSGCMGIHCNRDITYCPNCGAPPLKCNCCAPTVYAPPATLCRASEFDPSYEYEVEEVPAKPQAPSPQPNGR